MADKILNFLTDTNLKMNGQHPILVLSGEDDFWAQRPADVRFIAHQDGNLIVKPGDRMITSQALETLLDQSAVKKPDMMASLVLSKYPIGELQRLHEENLLTPEQLAQEVKPVAIISWAKLNAKTEKVPSPQKSIQEEKIEVPKTEVAKEEEPTKPVEEDKKDVHENKSVEDEKSKVENEKPVVVQAVEEKIEAPKSEVAKEEEPPKPVEVKKDVPIEAKVEVIEKPKIVEHTRVQSPVAPRAIATAPSTIVYQPKQQTPPRVPIRHAYVTPPSGTTTIRNPNVTIQQVQAQEPQALQKGLQQQAKQSPPQQPAQQQVAQKKDTLSVLGYEISTPAALMMGTFGLIGGCAALYFLTRNKGGQMPPSTATPALPGPNMTPQFNLNSI